MGERHTARFSGWTAPFLCTFLCLLVFPASAAFAQISSKEAPSNIAKEAPIHRQGSVSVARLRVPNKAHEQLMKAAAAYKKNKVNDALHHVNAAIAIAPGGYPEALTFRASIELNLNRFDAAIDDLKQSLQSDPQFGLTYLEMGAVLNHLGRYDEALRNLERSERYDPASWRCAYEMSRSWLGKRDYPRTLEQINRAASLGGDAMMGSTIHFVRAHALAGLNEYRLASVELEMYLSSEPNGKLAAMAREMLDRIRVADEQGLKER
jgi:tetratricopeptide (TPR) repeat protein